MAARFRAVGSMARRAPKQPAPAQRPASAGGRCDYNYRLRYGGNTYQRLYLLRVYHLFRDLILPLCCLAQPLRTPQVVQDRRIFLNLFRPPMRTSLEIALQNDGAPTSNAFDALLADFGRYIGIENLAADEGGECILSFDDVFLRFSHRADQNELLVAAAVMDAPAHPSADFFASILELNATLAMHGEGSIGLEPGDDSILWFTARPMTEMAQQAFQDLVHRTVDCAEACLKANALSPLVGWKSASGAEPLPAGASAVRV